MGSLRFLLLFLAFQPLRGFNVDTSKRWVSPPTSPQFGHRVLQHSDGRRNWVLVTSLGPGDFGTLYKCEVRDELRCEAAGLGGNVQKLKKLQAGIALAQSPGQILVCLQQKRRQWRKVTSELNGVCALLAGDFREKAFLNLTDLVESKLSAKVQRRKRSGEDVDQFDRIGVHSTFATLCYDPEDASARKDPEDGRSLFGANANNNIYMEDEEEDDSGTFGPRRKQDREPPGFQERQWF